MSKTPPLALVTGAAHRLGRQIALALGRAGFAIGLHYHRSESAAEKTADELRAIGAAVFPLRADLSRPEEVQRLFEEVDRLEHPLRLLVNSAAVMTRANLLDMDPQEWDSTLALNLRAPLLCAQAAARRMPEEGGLIINLTDMGTRKTWTGYPAYIVSKSGLESLTRLLARALAPRIRVNALAPGLILPAEALDEAEWQRLVERVPMRRAGDPEEIARAVLFLWETPYITGQTIVIDGGYELI